jgi:SAM-dependent methyltransferase
VTFDDPSYWRALHQAHPGSLKAVGHPWLSEALNRLKYGSEAGALLQFLDSQRAPLTANAPLHVLDVGAGTGFWSEMLQSWCREQGVTTQLSALDLSEEALSLIKARHPEIETIQADLSSVDRDRCRDRFHVVLSCYCLHHLPKAADFLNGLQFAARSVAPGGFLVLMDPILSQRYSPFHPDAVAGPERNGMPRRLSVIDDATEPEGLGRIVFTPAVSFILNGSIEGRSRLGYALTNRLWCEVQRLYRSERVTWALSGALTRTDAFLKRHGLTYSSSLAVYRKKP